MQNKYALATALLLLTAACARPGEVSVEHSAAAEQRLLAQAEAADQIMFERVMLEARQSEDRRTQRRALELGKRLIERGGSGSDRILEPLSQIASRLAQDCATADEAARFYRGAQAHEQAAQAWSWEARSCERPAAATSAASEFVRLSDCTRALQMYELAYRNTAGHARIRVLDQASQCAPDNDLARHLRFASAEDIEALYAARHQAELDRQAAEEDRRIAEEQAQVEAERAAIEAAQTEERNQRWQACYDDCQMDAMECNHDACHELQQSCEERCDGYFQ